MTTETDFQAALDLHPDDHGTRLVLADWLDERDDPRGPGYRALGLCRVRPSPVTIERWALYCAESYGIPFPPADDRPATNFLPRVWFNLIPHVPNSSPPSMAGFDSRRAAEDAAALAFAQLPPARRAELLALVPAG